MKEKERQIVINGGDRKKCNKSGNWKKKTKKLMKKQQQIRCVENQEVKEMEEGNRDERGR